MLWLWFSLTHARALLTNNNNSGGELVGGVWKPPKEYVVKFTFPEAPPLEPPYIQVMDMGFHYPDRPLLFRGCNFGIHPDSRVAIVGPNGVGKSTLLNLMTGVLQPTEGEVRMKGGLRVGVYAQHFVDKLPMDISPVEHLQKVRCLRLCLDTISFLILRWLVFFLSLCVCVCVCSCLARSKNITNCAVFWAALVCRALRTPSPSVTCTSHLSVTAILLLFQSLLLLWVNSSSVPFCLFLFCAAPAARSVVCLELALRRPHVLLTSPPTTPRH